MPLGCPRCHAVNSDAAKYCNECGSALHDRQPRVETPAISADPPKASPVPAPREKQPSHRADAPRALLPPPHSSCLSTGKKVFAWLLLMGGEATERGLITTRNQSQLLRPSLIFLSHSSAVSMLSLEYQTTMPCSRSGAMIARSTGSRSRVE